MGFSAQLVGMRIRDRAGKSGLVRQADDAALFLHMTEASALFPEQEIVWSDDSARIRELEVLTLTEGWKPMLNEFDVERRPRSLVEDLNDLFSEIDEAEAAELKESRADETLEALEEAKRVLKSAASKKKGASKASGKNLEKAARSDRRSSKKKGAGHNPFKSKDHLGPGPRGGQNSKTDNWKCSCATPYKCLCRAGKRKKVVRIKRDYKKVYNKQYKAWAKDQRRQ